jgi:hypothetical protein
MMIPDDTPRNPPPSASDSRAGRAAEPPLDPWSGWTPRWDDRRGPHAAQERHSPTEQVSHRAARGAPEERSQRRIVDARLWGAMTPAQQDAACAIASAVETMGRGIGFASSKWDGMPRTGGRGNIGAAHGRLVGLYVDWTKECHKNRVSHAMIADVLVLGHSCAEVDRNRRVRKGTTRRNLFDGLALYCEIRGWR